MVDVEPVIIKKTKDRRQKSQYEPIERRTVEERRCSDERFRLWRK
jgi:hypothetical protein